MSKDDLVMKLQTRDHKIKELTDRIEELEREREGPHLWIITQNIDGIFSAVPYNTNEEAEAAFESARLRNDVVFLLRGVCKSMQTSRD